MKEWFWCNNSIVVEEIKVVLEVKLVLVSAVGVSELDIVSVGFERLSYKYKLRPERKHMNT